MGRWYGLVFSELRFRVFYWKRIVLYYRGAEEGSIVHCGYFSYGFVRLVACLWVWIGRSMLLLMCLCGIEAEIQAIPTFGIRSCGAGGEIER